MVAPISVSGGDSKRPDDVREDGADQPDASADRSSSISRSGKAQAVTRNHAPSAEDGWRRAPRAEDIGPGSRGAAPYHLEAEPPGPTASERLTAILAHIPNESRRGRLRGEIEAWLGPVPETARTGLLGHVELRAGYLMVPTRIFHGRAAATQSKAHRRASRLLLDAGSQGSSAADIGFNDLTMFNLAAEFPRLIEYFPAELGTPVPPAPRDGVHETYDEVALQERVRAGDYGISRRTGHLYGPDGGRLFTLPIERFVLSVFAHAAPGGVSYEILDVPDRFLTSLFTKFDIADVQGGIWRLKPASSANRARAGSEIEAGHASPPSPDAETRVERDLTALLTGLQEHQRPDAAQRVRTWLERFGTSARPDLLGHVRVVDGHVIFPSRQDYRWRLAPAQSDAGLGIEVPDHFADIPRDDLIHVEPYDVHRPSGRMYGPGEKEAETSRLDRFALSAVAHCHPAYFSLRLIDIPAQSIASLQERFGILESASGRGARFATGEPPPTRAKPKPAPSSRRPRRVLTFPFELVERWKKAYAAEPDDLEHLGPDELAHYALRGRNLRVSPLQVPFVRGDDGVYRKYPMSDRDGVIFQGYADAFPEATTLSDLDLSQNDRKAFAARHPALELEPVKRRGYRLSDPVGVFDLAAGPGGRYQISDTGIVRFAGEEQAIAINPLLREFIRDLRGRSPNDPIPLTNTYGSRTVATLVGLLKDQTPELVEVVHMARTPSPRAELPSPAGAEPPKRASGPKPRGARFVEPRSI